MNDFYFCNICNKKLRKFELSPEGIDKCPICRSVGRHRAIAYLIKKMKFPQRAFKAIEIGGDGRFFKHLFNLFISIDLHNFGLDVIGDATQLPFASEYFDAILCLDVLEHTIDDTSVVKEMHRVLRAGGYLFVTASCWEKKGRTKTPSEVGFPAYHLSMDGKWDCLCYRYYTYKSLIELIDSNNLHCKPIITTSRNMGIKDIMILIARK